MRVYYNTAPDLLFNWYEVDLYSQHRASERDSSSMASPFVRDDEEEEVDNNSSNTVHQVNHIVTRNISNKLLQHNV